MEKKIAKLFLIVILLYQSQGLFYRSGSTLSRLFVLVWLLIALIYAFKLFLKTKTTPIDKFVILFVFMHGFYWLVSPKVVYGDNGMTETYQVLKYILMVQLSYFPFRYFASKEYIKVEDIRWFCVALLLISIPQFFRHQAELMSMVNLEHVTNNDSYIFAGLLPLFMSFLHQKKILYPSILIIFCFILLGAKRGAILCAIVMLLLFLYYIWQSMYFRKAYFLFFIFLILAILVGYNFVQNYEYLQMRLLSTRDLDTSGRSEIYTDLYTYCRNRTNFFESIFGDGFMHTENVAGITAHNDWLELWTNNGYMGMLLYLCIYIALFDFYRKNIKFMSDENKAMYLGACLLWGMKSVYSMGYYDPCVSLSMLAIAYVESVVILNRRNVTNESSGGRGLCAY